MRYLHFLALTRRHPSAILLLVQLSGLVLYPLLESTRGGRWRWARSASRCW